MGLLWSKNTAVYIYLNESVPIKNQVLSTAVLFSIDPFIPLAISSPYFFFGGKNWKIPLIPSLIIPIIAFVSSFFLPESPRYLYAKRDWKGLRKVIKTIARINGVNMDHDYLIDQELKETLKSSKNKQKTQLEQHDTVSSLVNTNQKEEYSVLKALKESKTVINLLVAISLFSFISFNYYLIDFYLKYIGGNIFVNTFISLISECVGNFMVGYMHRWTGTKLSLIISYTTSFVAGAPLLFSDNSIVIAI